MGGGGGGGSDDDGSQQQQQQFEPPMFEPPPPLEPLVLPPSSVLTPSDMVPPRPAFVPVVVVPTQPLVEPGTTAKLTDDEAAALLADVDLDTITEEQLEALLRTNPRLREYFDEMPDAEQVEGLRDEVIACAPALAACFPELPREHVERVLARIVDSPSADEPAVYVADLAAALFERRRKR